nr:unnamed protein product [Callosobruchus chinensis]
MPHTLRCTGDRTAIGIVERSGHYLQLQFLCWTAQLRTSQVCRRLFWKACLYMAWWCHRVKFEMYIPWLSRSWHLLYKL